MTELEVARMPKAQHQDVSGRRVEAGDGGGGLWWTRERLESM